MLGDLFISDFNNNRVRMVDPSSSIITTYAGSGIAGYGGDGGPASLGQLRGPNGIALDGAGYLYIADSVSWLLYYCAPELVLHGAHNSIPYTRTLAHAGEQRDPRCEFVYGYN